MNLSETTNSNKHPSETNVIAAAQAAEAAATEEVEAKVGEGADVEEGENVEQREEPAVDEVWAFFFL